jgi:hypothetical protein
MDLAGKLQLKELEQLRDDVVSPARRDALLRPA